MKDIFDMHNSDSSRRFATDSITGHLKRYCVQANVDMRLATESSYNGHASVCMTIDRYAGELCYRLIHDVYCFGETRKTFELSVSFTVPDTWFDAFKERFCTWIPGWVLLRWPIRTRVLSKTEKYTVDAVALLPGVPVRLGENRMQFAVQVAK